MGGGRPALALKVQSALLEHCKIMRKSPKVLLCLSSNASGCADNRALSVLNLAENNLGELVLPEGWTEDYDSDEDEEVYKHADGREQKGNPGKPEGIVAIANAILDMSALSSLNLSANKLCGVWIDRRGRQKGTFDSAGKHSNIRIQ
jgi:hypothetical protein